MVDNNNPSSCTEAQVRRWVDEGVVEWWGDRDDMAGVFAASHVVVLPSYGEGFPKVLLEAAACARPLIATRVRGCQEIVRDGENGLLIPPKDPEALAHAIATLLGNKALRERMGAMGREIVLKEFRADLIAEATIAVYDRLLRTAESLSPHQNDRGMRPPKPPLAYSKAAGKKPRLLFLIDEDRDFCTHRLDLGRAAREAGFEVLVATHVQRHAKQIEEEGFKLVPIKLRRGVQSPLRDLAALIELIRLYRREKPEIIHHVALKQVVFGGIAARIVRAPAVVNAITGLGYLVQSEGLRPRLIRSAIKPALRWVLASPRSAVILQNDCDCEELVQAGMVKRSQVVVIRGAGVNVSVFCPSPEPNGVPVVVLAARMLRTKGIGEFVQAARLVKSNGIQVRCVLAGTVDKENPATLSEEELRRWEEDGVVEWWGQVDDMAGVFAQSQVVVLPTYYGEGLPKVLLEAAACGRPLVATRVRGCQEIVRDGENGLLVPPKDPEALALAIVTLLRDSALRSRMGACGRDIVVKEFSAERIAGETIAVYGQLLGNSYAFSLARG
jgi:glycosyltransferase involved in cell wall biosynthesis